MAKYLFLLLLCAAIFIYFSWSGKLTLTNNQTIPKNQPTVTPIIEATDSANTSIDDDITALDRDLEELRKNDASFSAELKNL